MQTSRSVRWPLASLSAVSLAALSLAVVLGACPQEQPIIDPPVPPVTKNLCKERPRLGEVHTVHYFDDVAEFFNLADLGANPVQAKFVLTKFGQETPGPSYFMDPTFYKLHDEWYWMRLLNGHVIEGYEVAPIEGMNFESIAEVYAYMAGGYPPLLDLRWSGDRVYSPKFYEASLEFGSYQGKPRFFGIGSVNHYAANPKRLAHPDALWVFELEYYYEKVNAEKLDAFFQSLESCLPESVADKLMWVSRGTAEQDALVEALKLTDGPYKNRVLNYLDLAVDGEFGVYNAGITAGKIRRYDGALGGASVDSQTIVVANTVPDYLPPVAGIVTAVPQTPLAHLNLLAKARGTPNAYLGGSFEDPRLANWEKLGTPVIMRANEDEGVGYKAITNQEYNEYRSRLGAGALTVQQIDVETAPHTIGLANNGLAGMAGYVPLTGGKCAGFLAFNDFPQMETPHDPMCITIRAYYDHIKSFRPMIEGLLLDVDFVKDQRARFATLEGEERFREEHVNDANALAWFDTWYSDLPDSRQIKAVIDSGGLKALIRGKPLAWTLKDTVETALTTRYGDLGHTQGLRFRSSSTAEDIPGFNGAGLYDSNTGFLYAHELSGKDKTRTVENALKKTWASYWSYEAFEERRLAGIAHLSGNMAVLVHPRFDDELEQANGVITVTIRRGGGTEAGDDAIDVVVNVQKGAVSVTNPDPNNPTTPEIDRLVGDAGTAGTLERIQASSLVAAGETVLTSDELQFIYARLTELVQGWLDNGNTAWDPPMQSTTVVLDLEFKRMAKAWPAWGDGHQAPQDRLIFKQVRVLDNPIWVSNATAALPVPRDLLSVTGKVVGKKCTGPLLEFETVEFITDPAKSDLLSYTDTRPFTPFLKLSFLAAVPSVGVELGGYVPDHTQLKSVTHFGDSATDWKVRYEMPAWLQSSWGLAAFEIAGDGSFTVDDGTTTYSGDGLSCTTTLLEVGAAEYLEQLWLK